MAKPRRLRKKKKPVNPAASALARLRWSRTPKAERSAPARKAIQARWAKAKGTKG